VKKNHILIIRFSALGDVAMTVPVVYSLAHQYPDVRITVLSRRFARPFFEGLAPNVGFMEADLKREYHGIKGLNMLFRRLAAKQFTHIADFHSVLRSEFLRMRFNLGNYKVAHINKHRKGRRQLTSGTNKQLVQQPTSFEKYADVLARLGFPVEVDFHSIYPEGGGDLSLLPDQFQFSTPDTRHHIGIAPFAAHQGKVYPLHLMQQVIELLIQKYPDARIFLFGKGECEDKQFTEWCSRYQQCVYVKKDLETIKEELILMSHLDVMLSMDSANMHLASLVATPVVSVWGATHPYAGFMGWNQDPDNIIQTPLDCRPCSIYGQKSCRRGDYACMNRIDPTTIVERIDQILSKKPHV
jgi:ADP-heptose:LPS heptosyltransferase